MDPNRTSHDSLWCHTLGTCCGLLDELCCVSLFPLSGCLVDYLQRLADEEERVLAYALELSAREHAAAQCVSVVLKSERRKSGGGGGFTSGKPAKQSPAKPSRHKPAAPQRK